ncbi:uncharacterized protein LOC134235831 [Saccostrea cucullata]|uniref:uncharacterized protein LOC134235831 n=1 Tax=Saccostrea cuccullata TaxID=36930 RepID=UPI002ED63188
MRLSLRPGSVTEITGIGAEDNLHQAWYGVSVHQVPDGTAFPALCRHPASFRPNRSQGNFLRTQTACCLHEHQLGWKCSLAAQELEDLHLQDECEDAQRCRRLAHQDQR